MGGGGLKINIKYVPKENNVPISIDSRIPQQTAEQDFFSQEKVLPINR